MWTIDSAQGVVSQLREHNTGYFIGLTGGVLYRGFSHHDLDIVCVSITGRDQQGKILGVCKARLGWDLVSFWNYTAFVTVYKFKDRQGRTIELWVNACSRVSYGPIAFISKNIKAAARQVRYFLKGYK